MIRRRFKKAPRGRCMGRKRDAACSSHYAGALTAVVLLPLSVICVVQAARQLSDSPASDESSLAGQAAVQQELWESLKKEFKQTSALWQALKV